MPTHPIRDDEQPEVEIDQQRIFVCRPRSRVGGSPSRKVHSPIIGGPFAARMDSCGDEGGYLVYSGPWLVNHFSR